MITIVDRSDSAVIQKITSPKGNTVRYQVVPNSSVGDASAIVVANTLVAARCLIGKGPNGKPFVAESQH